MKERPFLKKLSSLRKWPVLKKWPLLERWRFSQKRVLWGVMGVVLLILLYTFAIIPLVEARKNAEEEILLKRRALLRYEEYLGNRKTFEEELDRTLKQYEMIQARLLAGETPQLGAASLQEIVRRLSEKDGVGIRSFRMLEPKEIDSYRRISIQIDFNPNNISDSEWVELGFKDWQIKTINNYKNKGGSWKTKTDVANIYGLDAEHFEKLKPEQEKEIPISC